MTANVLIQIHLKAGCLGDVCGGICVVEGPAIVHSNIVNAHVCEVKNSHNLEHELNVELFLDGFKLQVEKNLHLSGFLWHLQTGTFRSVAFDGQIP